MRNLTAYLAAAGITGDAAGPATTALQALLTDAQSEINSAQASAQQARDQVQSEIRENQQARALAGAFRKVAEKAGVDLGALSDSTISQERRRELADGATQQVLDYVSGAGEQAEGAVGILKAAGFDLDAYQKAGKEKRTELARQFADSVNGNRERLRLAERSEVLRELNLDPKKAAAILGDVTLEKGKVTVTQDGQQAEQDTYGVKGADGAFTPIEQLFQAKGFSLAELAPATTTTTAETQAPQQPLWVPQPSVNAIQSTAAVTDADADRARMQSGQYSPF